MPNNLPLDQYANTGGLVMDQRWRGPDNGLIFCWGRVEGEN